MTISPWISVTAVIGFLYASLCEWLLHRYVMHRPLFGFMYPYRQHTHVHHHVFKADQSYICTNEKDRKTIPMAWWNWLVLVPLATLLTAPVSLPIGLLFGHVQAIGITLASTIAVYYGLYEGLHMLMHLPIRIKKWMHRFVTPFKWLNGHHLLHHRQMGKNFNVVFPFWDLVLGTLVIRSKTRFKQAIGDLIPDVQPRTPLACQPL